MPELADRWRLENFIDALIFELDKAQDTLAVKGINRRLTYTVRDVAVDLNVFPDYSRDDLRFSVARPGDEGASRITFQLGSITDQQIKETTRDPVRSEDIAISEVEELEPELRESLRRVGVNSARDLERMERRNVDLDQVVREKVGKETPRGTVSYDKLATIISKARRKDFSPTVQSVSLAMGGPGEAVIDIAGKHLEAFGPGYPMAVINGEEVAAENTASGLRLRAPIAALRGGTNQLDLALDKGSVLHLQMNNGDNPAETAQ
ncbi:hypothetical protein [Aurantiacibacter sediminis]|uniref:Uncharacterized protein n=1 Tax=Aurantiacibacter sediminis TaxID=2793064 RepID=A0ABS0N3C6_9SPHN|nr:hypothetical protein [Aurantiacibacter sediminis]MBH5322457.1 hypothetical protein [Aurantiacibacter sediminis]